MDKPLSCPCCGSDGVIERDSNIFRGGIYSDRYPPDVARQTHGYQIRCVLCGLQTCWWHYEQEAVRAWNKRQRLALGVKMVPKTGYSFLDRWIEACRNEE